MEKTTDNELTLAEHYGVDVSIIRECVKLTNKKTGASMTDIHKCVMESISPKLPSDMNTEIFNFLPVEDFIKICTLNIKHAENCKKVWYWENYLKNKNYEKTIPVIEYLTNTNVISVSDLKKLIPVVLEKFYKVSKKLKAESYKPLIYFLAKVDIPNDYKNLIEVYNYQKDKMLKNITRSIEKQQKLKEINKIIDSSVSKYIAQEYNRERDGPRYQLNNKYKPYILYKNIATQMKHKMDLDVFDRKYFENSNLTTDDIVDIVDFLTESYNPILNFVKIVAYRTDDAFEASKLIKLISTRMTENPEFEEETYEELVSNTNNEKLLGHIKTILEDGGEWGISSYKQDYLDYLD
jgi:hypothetical protein